MSPRMVPLTVCARREYIAASTRLAHITTRNMFLPTDVFSILFCRSGVIGLLWTNATLVTHGLSNHNQERRTALASSSAAHANPRHKKQDIAGNGCTYCQ